MDLENIIAGVEHGHWTKSLRAWEDERRAAGFVALVSVLANAIDVHGDALRASMGHAGNQEPPAIISLETGLCLEEHLKDVVAGGSLEGCGDASTVLGKICNAVEDRKGAVHFELSLNFDDLDIVTPVTNTTGGSHECDWNVCVRFSMRV